VSFVGRDELANRRIPIVIDRTCQARKLIPIRLVLAFDRVGRPDRPESKLR
jgi:hypothetical protein